MVISTFRHLPWCMGAAVAAPSTSSASPAALFQACHSLATASSHNLRNHILGLIGMGNIGQQLAAKLGCPAFGMRVHYFDIERKPAALEAELGATFHPTLAGLLAVADCVVLCTPASPTGEPLITAAALAQTKPGARFVNIARGSLVDEEALAAALESGRLSAAALDVHAAEPRVHPRLAKLAGVDAGGRVMLTCHNAGGTAETHAGFEELSMRNIMAVLGGGEALTPVNLQYLKRG
jgi:lactate dehydrogenase-like 2-hydroxyacid dehydrogenase